MFTHILTLFTTVYFSIHSLDYSLDYSLLFFDSTSVLFNLLYLVPSFLSIPNFFTSTFLLPFQCLSCPPPLHWIHWPFNISPHPWSSLLLFDSPCPSLLIIYFHCHLPSDSIAVHWNCHLFCCLLNPLTHVFPYGSLLSYAEIYFFMPSTLYVDIPIRYLIAYIDIHMPVGCPACHHHLNPEYIIPTKPLL